MLPQRVYRIFLRYADRNLTLAARGGVLADGQGREIGQVDALRLHQNRLIVQGRTRADRIGVQHETRRSWVRPARSGAAGGLAGFVLDVPFEAGPLDILTALDGQDVVHPFDGISARRVAWARLRLAGPFVAALIRLTPQIWRWKRRGDLGAREKVKEGLGLVPRSYAAELQADVLTPAVAPPCPFGAVTLVMPVHNAFDLLRAALARIEAHTDLDWRLVLIEDASTDQGLRDWLQDWAADPRRRQRVHLLCNDRNLGFIGSVNRGFALARDWPEVPVVLINSDALVPAGWASRLLAPLADPDVASVTPLSNDAEIFTVPVLCQRHALPMGMGDALDAAAAGLGQTLAQAPTGVGFCMALGPRFLAALPAFDTAFGRGYGEETDWCQKASARGGRHLCAGNLFVEHRGGASFGSVAKQKLLARNGAEISRRYPGYDEAVQQFIRSDPLTTTRLALALSWAALHQDGPVPVYLAHAMGGGAEKYLQARIAGDLAGGAAAVVLRVGQGHRWKLELHAVHGVTAGLSDDLAVVQALVARLPRRRIIYSCGVGDRDAIGLPGVLLALAGAAPQIEVLFHDFFPISPSYTLLGQNSDYHGAPGPDQGGDAAHQYRRPNGALVDLAAWQSAWAPLIAAAERVVVFSPSSRDLVAAAYPAAAGAIQVVPHALPGDVPRIVPQPRQDAPLVIGVLGNIGVQKGAAVVQKLARDMARSDAAQLVVIGHLAPEFTLPAPSRVHGAYRLEDLPGLVARYGIDVWLIPSVWPETFSFTTHEALATGMPVFCFDLGAQADAVRAAPNGHLVPWASGGGVDTVAVLAAINAKRPVLEPIMSGEKDG